MNRAYLAVDLGASSGRVITAWIDTGQIHQEEIHRFENGPVLRGDTLYWEFERLWLEIQHGLKTGVQRIKAAGRVPVSIGVDSWGVDFGLLSAGGALLAAPVHYRDHHTDGIMEELIAGGFSRALIFEETGIQFMPFNTIYQLAALKKRSPDILDKADVFLMISDLIHFRLTGQKVCEFSNATTTQLYNPRRGNWSDTLIEATGLRRGIFPSIVKPGAIIGPLLDDLAAAWGAVGTTVIAAATHDTGSAVAAVPSVTDRFAYLSCGTWSLLGTEVSEPVITSESLALNFTNEGGVNGTFRLLKNIMGLWLLQECRGQWKRQGHSYTWEELNSMARNTAPLVCFVDPDDSRFVQPGDMPSRIREFCATTGQPVPESDAAVVRCVLESLSMRCRTVLDMLESLSGPMPVLHMVGGGTQNKLLCQWTANACARTVIAGPTEAAALGNAGIQMLAAGEIESLPTFRAKVRQSFPTAVYNPEDQSAWQEARRRFEAVC